MYNFMKEGFYDCLTMKKNEISGQKLAFVKKTYEHKFVEGGYEIKDSINAKHEKFKKVGKILKKTKEVPGNKTPYWVGKLHTAVIEGVDDENIIQFSVEEDTPEIVDKYLKIDIALKKFHSSKKKKKSDK